MRLTGLLFAVSLVGAAKAPAQDEGIALTTAVVDASDSAEGELTLELRAASNGGRLSDSASLRVVIRNNSDKQFRGSLSVRFPAAFESLRARPGRAMPLGCMDLLIPAKKSLECFQEIAAVSPIARSVVNSSEAVFFWPASYPVRATFKYREDLDGKPEQLSVAENMVRFDPPVWSVAVGGVVGVVLLGLFVGVSRARLVLASEGIAGFSLSRVLRYGLLLITQVLAGGTVAVITILLIQRVAGFELPIQVEVKDLWGGVVVGLFSGKVGETLASRLV